MSEKTRAPPLAEASNEAPKISGSMSSHGEDGASWENISMSQQTAGHDKVESLSDQLSSEEPSPNQALSSDGDDKAVPARDGSRDSDDEGTLPGKPALGEGFNSSSSDDDDTAPTAKRKSDKEQASSAAKSGKVEHLQEGEDSVVNGESNDAPDASDPSSSSSEDDLPNTQPLAKPEIVKEESSSDSEESHAEEAGAQAAAKGESEKSSSSSDDEVEVDEGEERKTAPPTPAKASKSSSSSSSSSGSSGSEDEDEDGEEEKLPVAPKAKVEDDEGEDEENSSSEESEEEKKKRKSPAKVVASSSSSSEGEDEDGSSEEEVEEALPAPPPVPKRVVEREREPSQTQAMEPSVHKRAGGLKSKSANASGARRKSQSSSSSSSSEDGSSSAESPDLEAGRARARNRRRSASSEGEQDDDENSDDSAEEEGSGSSDGDSESSSGSKANKQGLRARLRNATSKAIRSAKRMYSTTLRPGLTRCNKALSSSRFGPQVARLKTNVGAATVTLREDWGELKRLRRSLATKPRSEWNLKQLPGRTKIAAGRILVVALTGLLCLLVLLSSGGTRLGILRSSIRRSSGPDYPPNWKRTRQLSFQEIMDLLNVYDNSLRNDSSVKIKKMPTLDKPIYSAMTSKDLIQIKRPAVRKKRPDEPRAVRTFGCLRDGCRGLEIEDLLDRGWQMRFRAAQKNDTYKNINYRVTFLLTDTTQLNHMRAIRPDLYESIYNTYEGKSYLIAFDGADAIGGNKGQQLKVKERFVRRFGCKFAELAISPAAYRLYLEDECHDLVNFGSSEATWLLKPETGSQGQGITFHTEISDIMQKQPKFFPCAEREWKATERYLVQEYIEHPLLLKKSKFDARVYMNVASSYPWLVFYHEGYLRRALANYAPLSRDRRVYLTNTHFQSMKKDFKLSEHIWSFQEFQAYLKDQGRTGAQYVSSILNPYIKKVAHFIFQSARAKLKKRKGTFHIMGLDFMIDEDFHVWFIEANGFPGFTWSINFDTRTMVEEWFNLAQQVHENPRFYMLMREGDRYGGFEMMFSEMEEERLQALYNPCQEFKHNRGYTAPLKEANRLFAQISGKGGKTERFKRFTNTIKGAHLIGGNRAEQLQARETYLKKFGCRLNSVHLTLPTYALYDAEQCNNFFTEYATSSAAWVIKPVTSPGNAEELRVFASQEAMKEEFGECTSRVPDYVVQQLIPDRPLVRYKWWDIRVYVLIAHTKPWLVFYHHGFARTSKLSYVPGGEAKSDLVEGGAGAGGSTPADGDKKDDEEEESAVELDEDDGGEDEADSKGADKAGDKSDKGGALGEDEQSMQQQQPLDPNNPLEPQPPAEPWAPPKITTGATWTLGEEFLTLEAMEDEMARADLVGSRWLSSVFDTYAKRVAHLLFQAARPSLERGNETYQITSLNFMLDHKMQIHFVGARNVDADSIPNVDVLQEHKANFLETLAGLVLELHTMPAAFARMRRGDSYGQWRVVFSEMEEHQRSMQNYDPCDEFKRNLQVSKSSLFKDAWLHQHTLKSHARNKRELRKYIDRKWDSSCKSKPTAELRASCIRNTISYRYKKYIEKERVPYQEGYVENYIRELEHRPKTSGGGGQGGGL